jgi:hypothetical protein
VYAEVDEFDVAQYKFTAPREIGLVMLLFQYSNVPVITTKPELSWTSRVENSVLYVVDVAIVAFRLAADRSSTAVTTRNVTITRFFSVFSPLEVFLSS